MKPTILHCTVCHTHITGSVTLIKNSHCQKTNLRLGSTEQQLLTAKLAGLTV